MARFGYPKNSDPVDYGKPLAYGPASAYSGGGAGGLTDAYKPPPALGSPAAPPGPPVVDPVTRAKAEADWANAEYMNAFQSNLTQSRQNIANQFQTALAGINASEGRGAQAVAQLPPMLQSIYGGTAATLDADAAASKASQMSTGLQSFTPAGAGVEPIKAASAAEFASRQADVPLLQLGVQQSFANQRGAAEAARQRALGDVEAQGMEGNLQALGQKSERAYGMSDALQQRQWAREDALEQRQWQLEDMGVEDAQNKKKELDAARAQAGEAPPDKSSAAYTEWLAIAHPKQYRDLVGSAPFRYAQKSVTNGLMEANDPGLGGAVMSKLTGQHQGDAPSATLDSGYDAGTTRKKLTLKDLEKKYKNKPKLLGALRYWYKSTGGGRQ